MKPGPGIRRLLRISRDARAVERDVDAELEFHVSTRVDILMARGLSRDAADEQARREFGDLRAAREEIAAIDRGRVSRARRADWREAFARWPLHGDVLEAFDDGRLEIGAHTLLEPHVWITAPAPGRVRIGEGTFLNVGVMVAAVELVEIGSHCMLANGCFVTDANHRFDDPDKPVPWQGFDSKGPTRIGDNVWLGANVVVTSGVSIGERCVVGANSVVTRDIPPFSIAAGAPAKVLRPVTYPD
jgi:acetyltransferase-like isoleucine patch superfamily enzyme